MGQAVSIREGGYEGMGNYATGSSTDYEYDEKKNFWENAHVVQYLIQNKLNLENEMDLEENMRCFKEGIKILMEIENY